jgi:hypothetical protein
VITRGGSVTTRTLGDEAGDEAGEEAWETDTACARL